MLTDGRDQKWVTPWVCSLGERLREQVVIVCWHEFETLPNGWEEHQTPRLCSGTGAQGCCGLRLGQTWDWGLWVVQAWAHHPRVFQPLEGYRCYDSLLTHAQLPPCCLAFHACPGLPWATDPSPHLARLLGWGCSETSMSTGVCIIGGASQTPYEWVWDDGTAAPRHLVFLFLGLSSQSLRSFKIGLVLGKMTNFTIFCITPDVQCIPAHPLHDPPSGH